VWCRECGVNDNPVIFITIAYHNVILMNDCTFQKSVAYWQDNRKDSHIQIYERYFPHQWLILVSSLHERLLDRLKFLQVVILTSWLTYSCLCCRITSPSICLLIFVTGLYRQAFIYLFICVCCTIISSTSYLFISVLQDKQQESTYFSFCCRVISHSISFLYGAYAFRGKDCSLCMFKLC
jgi:hypothetical protein